MRPSHPEVLWREPDAVLLHAGLPRRGLLFRKDESDWGQGTRAGVGVVVVVVRGLCEAEM